MSYELSGQSGQQMMASQMRGGMGQMQTWGG